MLPLSMASAQSSVLPTLSYRGVDEDTWLVYTDKDYVDPSSGEVAYKAAGSHTITASTVDTTSDSSVCDAASASYTLEVTKATHILRFNSRTTTQVAIGATITNVVGLTGVGVTQPEMMAKFWKAQASATLPHLVHRPI